MADPFVHEIDLEIGRLFGLPVYWYGAVYTIGFIVLCLYPLGIPTSWTRANIEEKRLGRALPAPLERPCQQAG